MPDATAVRVGVTGGVFGAPTATPLPTTAEAVLDLAFDELGYVSEDGVRENIAASVTEIKAWQNGDVVRKITGGGDVTYSFALMETGDAAWSVYYGSATGEVTGAEGIRQSWVIDVEDGAEVIRTVIPDGQVTERGEVTYSNGAAIVYPVVITAFPDGSGVKAYKYRSI